MSVITLLRIGEFPGLLLEGLRAGFSGTFSTRCEELQVTLDPAFAYHAERQQYHSTELLARLEKYTRPQAWRVLGVTEADLYIPILTFVFGEAQMGGRCAVVSTHRLHQELYGLPADDGLLQERLLKEAVHELGHTLGLAHCQDYGCVMAPSHGVEWIDIKGSGFCAECRLRFGRQEAPRSRQE